MYFKTILYTRLQVKENIQNHFISKVLLMLQTSYQITKSSLIQHTTHCTYHGTWKSSTFCRKFSARERSNRAGEGVGGGIPPPTVGTFSKIRVLKVAFLEHLKHFSRKVNIVRIHCENRLTID